MESKLKEERRALAIKVVEWAQKRKIPIRRLTVSHVQQAIRRKM